jgi:hypothetical protein
MSQFGAFDKSRQGMSAAGILQFYYPGAQLATIAPNAVKIRLMSDDNEPLDVYSDSGLTVADRRVDPGQVAHLTPTPGGGADVTITAGCAGDVVWRGATGNPWAYPVDSGPGRPPAEHLKICDGGAYRGALGVALDGSDIRTVDQVDTEDYLRGVVSTEMSADWADHGGTEALRAQAIAARSYALSENRYPYAQTCDTEDCQAYSGTEKEDPRTDAAVRDTAGQVLLRDGHLLHTEYSSAPNGGKPGDITTMAVGPSPEQLMPDVSAIPAAPVAPPGDGATPSLVDAKYAEIGGPASSLGEPLGPESPLPDSTGSFRMFRNGVIIATPAMGAQVVDFSTLLKLAPGATEDTNRTVTPGSADTPTPPPAPTLPTAAPTGRLPLAPQPAQASQPPEPQPPEPQPNPDQPSPPIVPSPAVASGPAG